MPAAESIMPFEEAIRSLQRRGVLPTDLTSAQLRQLGQGFHRQNFTSAKTLLEDLLNQYKADIGKIINPQTEIRTEDGSQRSVTVGMDAAEARLRAKQLLKELGYTPDPDDAGTLRDLSSDRRINLVIETNREITQGAGQFIQSQSEGMRDAFPCWELVRVRAPREAKAARDWPSRFLSAAETSGDTDAATVLQSTGRMIARKDSPLWQSLGDGPADSTDGLQNPFPPFAFNSGMDVTDIDYETSVQLGFIKPGEQVASNLPDDMTQIFAA